LFEQHAVEHKFYTDMGEEEVFFIGTLLFHFIT
jgi:hypothetical protein